MTFTDLLGLTAEALRAHRLRYGLSALAVAVGVGAVVLLASIGEGTRRFIMGQLTQFGTTLIGIHPGKVETGGMPGGMGGSARKLTLDDARALRRLPGAVLVVPQAFGSAIVEHGNRGRRVYVYGVTSDAPAAWSWDIAVGQNLPVMDWDRTSPVAVLGSRLKRELFGDASPLGSIIRIGQERYRVIGVMESKGQFLGFDLDDSAFIPVANALRLFNLSELSEIDVVAASAETIDRLAKRAEALLKERHDGNEDVTIVTQADAQAMIGRILSIVTGFVTGIAAISLLVGAIGIFTIMWIVVQERSAEVGLAKALGAKRPQILTWYLFEAAVTSTAGGLGGLVGGLALGRILTAVVRGLEMSTPPAVAVAAVLMALAVGLGAGVAPALRAARLDPIEALRGE